MRAVHLAIVDTTGTSELWITMVGGGDVDELCMDRIQQTQFACMLTLVVMQ